MQTVIDTYRPTYESYAKCQHPKCGYEIYSIGKRRDYERIERKAERHRHPMEVQYERH